MQKFSERLRSARKQKKLTQNQIAHMLSISNVSYSAYERAISIPSLDTACQLADMLDVSLDYLCDTPFSAGKHGRKTSNFQTQLRNERVKQNLSQTALAEKIGVMQTTYSAYERGRIQPGISTVSKLAGALNVSMDYLCGYEDNAPTAPTTTTATLLAQQVESLLRDLSPDELQEAVKAIETLTAIAKKKIPDTQKDRP